MICFSLLSISDGVFIMMLLPKNLFETVKIEIDGDVWSLCKTVDVNRPFNKLSSIEEGFGQSDVDSDLRIRVEIRI